MDQPKVLRTTKIGGGFVKEDVLEYVDELNSQIYALKEENDELRKKAASGGGLSDAQQAEFESEMTRLRGELGTTKNQLRAAQEELKNRPVIGADGAAAASPEELEAAKQEAEAAKQEALDAKADLASVQAELQLAQEEQTELNNKIIELESRLTTLNEDNDALRGELTDANARALSAGGDSDAMAGQLAELQTQLHAANNKVSEADREIAALRSELDAKIAMIEEQAGLSNESDLQKLAEYEAMLSEQSSTLAEKDREIERLQQENADLKENSGESAFDMSALFMEAQVTTKKAIAEANKKAARITDEAEAKAKTVLNEANAKAEKTVSEANKKAEETLAKATAEAEKKINDADAQAIKTIADAEESVRDSIAESERRTKTTTETAKTVRALLRSEIDAVSKKFNEISLVLENLSGQASSRLTEAKNVISEARGTVNDDDDLPSFESFDEVASKSFSKVGKGEFNLEDLADLAGNDSSWS